MSPQTAVATATDVATAAAPTDPQPSIRPRIGQIALDAPVGVAPMAGMTDTAFRRLVKRQGGCGLVVTEMVSSEGLVRGIDRTLEYAEYTEEERPVLHDRCQILHAQLGGLLSAEP